jgi:hypothetical protein
VHVSMQPLLSLKVDRLKSTLLHLHPGQIINCFQMWASLKCRHHGSPTLSSKGVASVKEARSTFMSYLYIFNKSPNANDLGHDVLLALNEQKLEKNHSTSKKKNLSRPAVQHVQTLERRYCRSKALCAHWKTCIVTACVY